VLEGAVEKLKPGVYQIDSNKSAFSILDALVSGPKEISVTIPEGSSIYDVDALLSAKGIIAKGNLIAYGATHGVEGYLFPDTYNFFERTAVADVVGKMTRNFDLKARPILEKDPKNFARNLTLASIVQNEVPTFEDEQAVASILKRRFLKGMPLQVDATVCYAKEMKSPDSYAGCYPLTPLDFKIDSPYNTYLYKGWPPGSISSPGISAILATVTSTDTSPYLYYLSDPKTKKTIFAATLEAHNKNKAIYLNR
jgi:UPF0755 protein